MSNKWVYFLVGAGVALFGLPLITKAMNKSGGQ